MTHETPAKNINIILKPATAFKFNGWYRRDLEKLNWHYYEEDDGTMLHFRKSEMIAVVEKEITPDEEAA